MDTKPWYLSRGVIGSLLAMIVSVFIFYNGLAPVSAEVPAELMDTLKDEKTLNAVLGAVVFFSGLLSWIGRVFASKSLTLK